MLTVTRTHPRRLRAPIRGHFGSTAVWPAARSRRRSATWCFVSSTRRGRERHRRAGGCGARHCDRRRQPLDLTVGGKSWFFYAIERLGGVCWPPRHLAGLDVAPRPASGQDPVGGAGGLSARRRAREADARSAGVRGAVAGCAAHDRPAGEIRRHLRSGDRRDAMGRVLADDNAMILDLCDIMNAELRDMAAAGCPLIQVEEPPHHMRAQQPDCTGCRSRVPHRGVQSPAHRRRTPRSGCTPAGS